MEEHAINSGESRSNCEAYEDPFDDLFRSVGSEILNDEVEQPMGDPIERPNAEKPLVVFDFTCSEWVKILS